MEISKPKKMNERGGITDKELREIQERVKNATSGPWVLQWNPDNHPSGKYGLHRILAPSGENSSADPHAPIFWGHGESYENHEANGLNDGYFLAHARTDIPRLMDEVRRLRGELTGRDRQP